MFRGWRLVAKLGSNLFCDCSCACEIFHVLQIRPLLHQELRKVRLFLANVAAQLKNKNIITDIKVDTNSKVGEFVYRKRWDTHHGGHTLQHKEKYGHTSQEGIPFQHKARQAIGHISGKLISS
ncbi:voltage dependent anion channel 1 [Actinidia rufa]|uniref:Voltage dependent anion channel 1 n=1 Tax=Actinidia rufa TaxID=165716 RepID=A0A7J0E6E5_9ERIC|nr:voltage dependent anion channel 1 [Actinidia rufa]